MPDDYAVIKTDLVAAYDDDVARRGALTPAAWRTTVMDDFVARCESAGLKSVLELGAGTGQLAIHATGRGLDVVPTDLSPGNVAAMVERGLPASLADFSDLPFEDASFDAAYAVNSLLHVPKRMLPEVSGEIRRVLRTDGLLMVVVWGGYDHEGLYEDDWLTPARFYSFYSDAAFVELDFPGFVWVECRLLCDIDESSHDLHPQLAILRAR